MDTIKDKNGKDLEDTEEIKKRCKENTKEHISIVKTREKECIGQNMFSPASRKCHPWCLPGES